MIVCFLSAGVGCPKGPLLYTVHLMRPFPEKTRILLSTKSRKTLKAKLNGGKRVGENKRCKRAF